VCVKGGCGALIADISKSRCSRCHLVHYCNRKCQRAHWKAHKPRCKSANKGAGAVGAAGVAITLPPGSAGGPCAICLGDPKTDPVKLLS
jgi:hypothetical protein